MIDEIWDFARGTFWGIFTQQKVPMSKTSMTNAKSSQADIMSSHLVVLSNEKWKDAHARGSLVVRASDSRPEGLGSMPPITLRVHTEYVLVKSVDPKVLWAAAVEITGAGGWRIFPSPPVPCLNCGGGDRWCRIPTCLRLWQLSFLPFGKDTITTTEDSR
ncbi:uncharacterized protein TNCV_2016421 [Trichonephila clavipes]|nr:uncharacterized protein TNCV_2016421 [Trichonephila clavipes]